MNTFVVIMIVLSYILHELSSFPSNLFRNLSNETFMVKDCVFASKIELLLCRLFVRRFGFDRNDKIRYSYIVSKNDSK